MKNITEKRLVIIFDIVVISIMIVFDITAHFIGKPIDKSIFESVAILLNVLNKLIFLYYRKNKKFIESFRDLLFFSRKLF